MTRRLLGVLFATVVLGTAWLVPSALAQEGTERFSTDETRRLSTELADAEHRADGLGRAIDATYEGNVGDSSEERRRLQEEQRATEDRAEVLRGDLAQARLEAVRNAPLSGSAGQRLEQARAKYAALESLKGWTGREVGLASTEYLAVDEERMAMDDEVARLEDEAASEEQSQPEEPRPAAPSPDPGEDPAAGPATGPVDEGSGGFNPFPALLLLLGGLGVGAYYYAGRRSGGKDRAPGTPLAPRPAARASGAKVGPRNPPPVAAPDPDPSSPQASPPPDPDPGAFDAAPPRPDGPESEELPHGGRRRRDVPPPDDAAPTCPSCGNEVGPRALFCRGCGHRMGGA